MNGEVLTHVNDGKSGTSERAEMREAESDASAPSTAFDLDGYFRRIRYTGHREATLETLQGIHIAHALSIPFENLDPLLGRTVRLDVPSLEAKLLRRGRGGYCYEQNLLLAHALRASGFRVTGLAARVTWNQPDGVFTPRTHMLLRVQVDGESYVSDVGFGVLTLTAPLRLVPGTEQPTPHEPFRLTTAGDDYVMEALVRGRWAALYRFDLAEQLLPDYELASWYLCNHPDSHFRKNLFAARAADDRRYALRGNELAVHHLAGHTERRTIGDVPEMRRVLREVLLLSLPDDPGLDAVLARVCGAHDVS